MARRGLHEVLSGVLVVGQEQRQALQRGLARDQPGLEVRHRCGPRHCVRHTPYTRRVRIRLHETVGSPEIIRAVGDRRPCRPCAAAAGGAAGSDWIHHEADLVARVPIRTDRKRAVARPVMMPVPATAKAGAVRAVMSGAWTLGSITASQ